MNRCFRNEGLSTRHNPEFTMLEVYQAYADCNDLMNLTETMIRSMAGAVLGTLQIEYQGLALDLEPGFPRITVEQSIVDANPDLDPGSLRDRSYLSEVCRKLAIPVEDHYGAGKLQIEMFEKTVESELRHRYS